MNLIDFGQYKGLEWSKLSMEYLHGLMDSDNKDALSEVLRRDKLPIEEQIVGFGKHIGSHWVDLSFDYLNWLVLNVEASDYRVELAHKTISYKLSFDDLEVVPIENCVHSDIEIIEVD